MTIFLFNIKYFFKQKLAFNILLLYIKKNNINNIKKI